MFEHQDDDNLSNLFRKSARALEDSEDMIPSNRVWEKLSKRLEEDEKTTKTALPLSKEKISNTSIADIAPTIKTIPSTSNNNIWYSIAALFTGVTIGLVYFVSTSSTDENIKDLKPIAEISVPDSSPSNSVIIEKIITPPPIAHNGGPGSYEEITTELITERVYMYNPNDSSVLSNTEINRAKKLVTKSKSKSNPITDMPGFKVTLSDGYVSKKYEPKDSQDFDMPIVGAAPPVSSTPMHARILPNEYNEGLSLNNENFTQSVFKEPHTNSDQNLINISQFAISNQIIFNMLNGQKTFEIEETDNTEALTLILSTTTKLRLLDDKTLVINDAENQTEEIYTLIKNNNKGTKATFESENGKKLHLKKKGTTLSIKYK